MEQMKALVTERHDFDKDMNQNISTFWMFWEYQESDGRNKTKDFPMEISCTRKGFGLRPRWMNGALYFWRNMS